MRLAVLLPAVCLSAAAWLGGCRGPAPLALAEPLQVDIPASAFPGAAAILSGFDPAEPDSAWRTGDQVLFGLRLMIDGEERHWLLHLRLLAPVGDGAAIEWPLRVNGEERVYASRQARVEVAVHDGDGKLLGSSSPLVPADFLATGFAAACDLVKARQQALPDGPQSAFYDGLDIEPLARATVSAMALLRVVEHDAVLAPLLWQVLERPSLWSVLGNLGARVVVRPRFHAAVELPVAAGFATPWRVPLQLLVNDELALSVEATVDRPAPPFALAGGFVGALARHPRKSGRALVLRLLAARRGPAAGGCSVAQRSLAIGRDIALESR
jgi:hypothetical protein